MSQHETPVVFPWFFLRFPSWPPASSPSDSRRTGPQATAEALLTVLWSATFAGRLQEHLALLKEKGVETSRNS